MHTSTNSSILTQTLPHNLPTSLPKLLPLPLLLLPPHSRGLHIRRTLIIRIMQQTYNTQQYRFRCLYRTPSFCRALVPVLVVFWGVEDRDAEPAVEVDVWVEGDGRFEG